MYRSPTINVTSKFAESLYATASVQPPWATKLVRPISTVVKVSNASEYAIKVLGEPAAKYLAPAEYS